jgi:hypothetical protein
MKKLNNSGLGHIIALMVIIVIAVAVAGLKVYQHANASTIDSTHISCVLNAPTAIQAEDGFDVDLYMTNNTKSSYTPLPVITVQTFDDNGTSTSTIVHQLDFQSVAPSGSSELTLLKDQQWSLGSTDQKAVFTARDSASAASCSKTVLRS